MGPAGSAVLVMILAFAFALGCSLALSVEVAVRADEPDEWKSFSPPPPTQDDVSELLRSGRVTFQTGPTRPSTVRGTPSTGSANQAFDAETQFRARYVFDSRCRYFWRGGELTIRVRYPRLEFLVDHEIWFRAASMAATTQDGFWELDLVRHELDHVRLSSDPAFDRLFRERVVAVETLRYSESDVRRITGDATLAIGDNIPAEALRKLVGEHVRSQFDQVVQMIELRYRELDRETRHGALPLPDEGPLRQWLGR